ncbi:MAG: CvpA family protein [Gammaproteobacteria bacterium]|jgi:membrane protein required for colicin V production
MTWFDLLVIVIVLGSGVFGYLRGFVKEAVALISWLVAIWFAWRLGASVEPMLGEWRNLPELRIWTARAAIFLLILLIGGLIGLAVRKIVHSTGLTRPDRLLGTAFGALRGAIVVGVIVIALQLTGLDTEAWWLGARLREYCEQAADIIVFYAQLGGEYLQENYDLGSAN